MIEIQLFGAARVMRDGAEVRLAVKKTIALVAYLAIEQRVTRAKVATLLWGEHDDDAARRNLRRELHRLREAQLADALRADDNHLVLSDEVVCDVTRFLAASERDATAALAAYHGPLLDGFDLADAQQFNDWLAAKREQLARRWSQVAASEAARREGQGDARGALEMHTRLLAHDPLQESHYANAMRLSYLLGERARALEWYERLRTVLRDELGLEPLPETAAFAKQVRAADHLAPLVARSPDAAMARFQAPLVGREAELRSLQKEERAIILIVGEPGIGKTRLADEFTSMFPHRMHIQFSETGRGAALYAVAQALRVALNDPARRSTIDALDKSTRREIARLLPELASSAGTIDDARTDVTREHFFGALVVMLAALSAKGAIWIDDLHWADEASLELFEQLAHALARDRKHGRATATVVATARTQELSDYAVANALALKLERASVMRRLSPAAFDVGATLQLVRALSGSARGELFAQRLQRATLGNLFFLLETIRFLFDSGDLLIDEQGNWVTRYDDATSDYAELPVPPTVQEAVVERVTRLGPATARVLEAAAIAGDAFALDEVQPATALSEWEALEGIERAAGASLVVRVNSHYRFGHDLARVAIDRNIGIERRRLIHLRLAETLIALGGRAARIARHLDHAGRETQAVGWHLTAARDAESVFAYADALTHYASALRVTPDAAESVAIHRARVELLRALHDIPAVSAELDALDAAAERLSAPGLAAEVLVQRTQLAVRGHRYADAIDFAKRASEHAGYARLTVRLREQLTTAGTFAMVEEGHYDEARHIYQHELQATPLSNPRYLGYLHFGMANLLTSIGADAEARRHLEMSVNLLREAGDAEQLTRSLNTLAYTQHMVGDTSSAIGTMEIALDDADRMHSVALLRNTLLNFVIYCLHAGDVPRAEALTKRASEVLRFTDDLATQARLQIRVAEVAMAKGELGTAIAAAAKSRQLIEDNGGGLPDFWPWYLLARLLWRCGDHAGATDVYRQLPKSKAWLPTAAPAVAFFSTVYGLPDNAADAIRALPKMLPGPGVMCTRESIEFFRAYALHVQRRDSEALSALEPGGVALKLSPFEQRSASVASLRLAVRAGLGRVDGELIDQATAMLSTAEPFESIELRAALAKAALVNKQRDEALAYIAHAQAMIDKLAASLEEQPERAASLRRFWNAQLPSA